MPTKEDWTAELKALTARLERETSSANAGPDLSIALQVAFLAVRHFAETHPRPTQVNQSQAAEMLGISYPTVRKLVRSGILPLNDCGLIPIESIDRARTEKKAAWKYLMPSDCNNP